MRTKEKDRIFHLYHNRKLFHSDTKNIAETFPYYNRLINELCDKSEKLYQLFLYENRAVNVTTTRKGFAKDKAIRLVLKLKRGVILHAIETGNKSLQRASDYTYSDFNRPPEEIRTARFHQVVNAAKRIKHPEHFGLTKETIAEAERCVKQYCDDTVSPVNRKKERARQAKQCRKLLGEISFILKEKMTPFIENIKDEFPYAPGILKQFLKPVKIGRPAEKHLRKRKSQNIEVKQSSVNNQNSNEPFVPKKILKNLDLSV